MTYLYCWWPTSKRPATPLALIFCFIAGLSLAACTSNQACTSCFPPDNWQLQPGQLAATGTAGTFAVKWIQVTPQQLQFYYLFLSTQHNRLQATARASHLANMTAASGLATTVQDLGQIRDYSVGVMHVAWAKNTRQFIGLQLTTVSPTGVRVGTWQLRPLEQLLSDRLYHTAAGMEAYPGAASSLPEADWVPVVAGVQVVSYVKIVLPGQPAADRSYVFVRSGDPAMVTTISKAEYLSIAGSANFTP